MPNTAEYKNYLFVQIPDVEGWEIRGEHSKRPYQLLSFYGEAEAIQLPPGSWQIIGKGDTIDWDGIVDTEEGHFKLYDAPNVDPYFNGLMENAGLKAVATSSAKSSGHSLLRSLGMEPGTTLVLKKQTKLK